MTRCNVCGGRLIPVDGHADHPSCSDAPGAEQIPAEHEARQLAIQGQAQAVATSPDDHAAAVEIIRQAATTMRTFGSNDCRTWPRWEHLRGPVRGAAFTTAMRRGWIRAEGFEASSSTATHAHSVRTYKSLIFAEAS